MRRSLTLLAILSLTGCAGAAVTVQSFQGVYSTHFDGVPDDAAICVVLTNVGSGPVDWTQLRLVSYSDLGEDTASWSSDWLYT